VPYGVAVNIPAGVVYEAGFDGPMSVIDTRTNKVTTTIPVPSDAFMITAENRATRIVYGTDCAAAGRVFVVDGNSSKIIASAPVGRWPRGLASFAPGGILFVADSLGRSVSVVSEKTSKVIATVRVGNEPSDVTLASNRSAYVANKLSNTVSVITWP
jgi:YVTN family beta-propeller protein